MTKKITTEFRIDFPSASDFPARSLAIATLMEKQSDTFEAQIAEIYQQQFAVAAKKAGLESPSRFPKCESGFEQSDRLFALILWIHVFVDEKLYDVFSAMAWRDTFTLEVSRNMKVVSGAFFQAHLGVPLNLSVDCVGLGM